MNQCTRQVGAAFVISTPKRVEAQLVEGCPEELILSYTGSRRLECDGRDNPTSYARKLVTVTSGGVLDWLDSVLERYSFDELGEVA